MHLAYIWGFDKICFGLVWIRLVQVMPVQPKPIALKRYDGLYIKLMTGLECIGLESRWFAHRNPNQRILLLHTQVRSKLCNDSRRSP